MSSSSTKQGKGQKTHGGDGFDGAEGVAFDTGDRHEAADRIASYEGIGRAISRRGVSYQDSRRDGLRPVDGHGQLGSGGETRDRDAPRQCSIPISAAASMISGDPP